MKTVLVTGANGALGRVMTAQMANEGYRVFAADRVVHGKDDIELDVCDQKKVAGVIADTKPDLLVHLAAAFTDDFEAAYALNVEATRNILNQVKAETRPIRVVLIGSAAEYGFIRSEDNPIREDHLLTPLSIYGLTKAWQSQLAGFFASQGVDVIVARIFNLEGPDLSERLFVGRVQKQIREIQAGQRQNIEVGPLSAIRDYISLKDATRQLIAIAKHGQSGQIYHVASGNPVVMRDLLARTLARYGLNMSIVREAAVLSNRTGYDVPEIYADISRTKQLLSL